MKIGFIGLGTMGAGMASNLSKGGYTLIVHDALKEAAAPFLSNNAQWADTPREVAEKCEVICLSLPGPTEVSCVAYGVNGLLDGIQTGGAVFDLSTNSPTVIREIGDKFEARGAHFLDAPVSGGPAGALSGKLALWVGGNKQIFEKHKSILQTMGDQVAYIGPIGAGSVAKLVHNCAGYTIQTAIGEVFTMGVKAGVEPLALWDAIRQGALGRRRTFDGLSQQFLPDIYDPPAFALKLAHKDVSLATRLAKEVGVPMRLSNMALEEMTEALNRGWGHLDSRSPLKLQQERAGVEIKVDIEKLKEVLKRDPAI